MTNFDLMTEHFFYIRHLDTVGISTLDRTFAARAPLFIWIPTSITDPIVQGGTVSLEV